MLFFVNPHGSGLSVEDNNYDAHLVTRAARLCNTFLSSGDNHNVTFHTDNDILHFEQETTNSCPYSLTRQ